MTNHYRTKYRLDTAVAIILIFLGTATVSAVFGMFLFPIFTHVCANQLLMGVARIGYGGVITLMTGLLLEAYNLYEAHKKHVSVLVAATVLMGALTIMMIHYFATAYSCQL
jgi:cytosine/uracil/thiamine/allantoin permease